MSAVALAALLLAAGALVLGNQDDREVTTVGAPPRAGPSTTTTPPTTTSPCRASEHGRPEDDTVTVLVHFECRDDPVHTVRAVERRVPRTPAVLRAALEQLVAGPTEEEVRRGFSSVFSEATAELLADVTLRRDGTAVIDFTKAVTEVPNISTTNLMAHTHRSIEATTFQFPQVQTVVLRIEGSEKAWCEFFAIKCQATSRAEWEETRGQEVKD